MKQTALSQALLTVNDKSIPNLEMATVDIEDRAYKISEYYTALRVQGPKY